MAIAMNTVQCLNGAFKREVLYNYLRIATAHLTTNCALLIVLIGMLLNFLSGMIKINDFI